MPRPRRRTTAPLAVTTVLLVLAGCGGDTSSPESIVHRRPNIVLVSVDDLDETTTPYLDAMPKTKALIADRGMTFTNAFAGGPVCCQATLLTGMYPHNSNVYESATGLGAFREGASATTIGVRLKDAGYTTAFIGKYLDGYEGDPSYVPPGWDEWFGLAGRGMLSGYSYSANHNGRFERFGKAGRDYQSDVLSRTAQDYVEGVTRHDEHEPFLLSVFPSAPQAPIGPAPRDESNPFDGDRIPSRPNVDEKDVADKPTWLRGTFPGLSARELRDQTSAYARRLGSLISVDDMIGAIADQLAATDELGDTVFVLTSNHGYSYGSHRIIGKIGPYEESVRVPLAMAGPGIQHGDSDELVSQIDVAPTLYSLAGAPIGDEVDGTSLVPLLQGPASAWREELLVEYRINPKTPLHTFDDVRTWVFAGDGRRLVPDYRAVRTADWMYIEWYQGSEHEYELYDMGEDPYQASNLLADPTAAASRQWVVFQLQRRLEELAACSGDACR
jgi:arylsulfatase A-like enzyme